MREVYIERYLEKEVKKASRFYPVVLVCGQRQVGKSTMLYKIKEKVGIMLHYAVSKNPFK